MSETESLLNKGVMIREGEPQDGPEKTLIVSGVGRGGTSMLSTLLVQAGVFMGAYLGEAVNEDQEIMTAFQLNQRALLQDLIARRNEDHAVWGFKVPNVQAFISFRDLALFRNPRLVLIFRDPLAIAEREMIAEHRARDVALKDAVMGLRNLVAFVQMTTCPALLLSYEKALLNPERLIDSLLAFCDLPSTEEVRQRLLPSIQPNSELYMRKARRQFLGMMEFLVDDRLLGWCWEVNEPGPVMLDLFIDATHVMTFKAGDHRPDLMRAGYGNGNHGFAVDIAHLNLSMDQTVTVRIAGRDFILDGSGKTLNDYLKPG